MKNVLIFASEIGSTKFIYRSIIAVENINFTFVLSNDQNPKQYNDTRFINFKEFDPTTIKNFDLGILSFNASTEDLIFGGLLKKNNISFGSYIDSWMNIEKKCSKYKGQMEMIGNFLLVPTLDLCQFIEKPLERSVEIYDVGHSDLENVEKQKVLKTPRRGVAIYSQPIFKYFGNTIFNEYDLVRYSVSCLKKYNHKLKPINIVLHPTENINKFNFLVNDEVNVNVSYGDEFESKLVLPKLAILLFTTRLINTYLEKTPTISLYNGEDESNKDFLKRYTIFSNNLTSFKYNISNYSETFEKAILSKISFLGSKKKFERVLHKLFD